MQLPAVPDLGRLKPRWSVIGRRDCMQSTCLIGVAANESSPD